MRRCAIPGCERPFRTRGLCTTHYERWRRTGTTELMWPTDVLERIAKRTTVTDGGCWLWQGRVEPSGYGKVTVGNRPTYVHRAAYEATHGPIPARMDVHHTCENKSCCNAEHLVALTRSEHRAEHLKGDLCRS